MVWQASKAQERGNLLLLSQVWLSDPEKKSCSDTVVANKGCEVLISKENGNRL